MQHKYHRSPIWLKKKRKYNLSSIFYAAYWKLSILHYRDAWIWILLECMSYLSEFLRLEAIHLLWQKGSKSTQRKPTQLIFLMPTLWLVFSRQERFYSTNAGRLSLMPHQHRTWEETAVGVRPSGPMNRIITSFCESCTLWSTQLPDAHWMWPNQSGFKWE